MKLIGIYGQARSGKDTVAEYLADQYQFIRMSFASPLKDAVQCAFNLTDEEVAPASKETVNPYWRVSYKMMLQFVGTELFRDKMSILLDHHTVDRKSQVDDKQIAIEKNFWIWSLNKRIQDLGSKTKSPDLAVVISDVRFQNEVDYIVQNNGILIHVSRPNAVGKVGIPDHPSEKISSLLVPTEVNYQLDNSGTIESLCTGVDTIVTPFTNR